MTSAGERQVIEYKPPKTAPPAGPVVRPRALRRSGMAIGSRGVPGHPKAARLAWIPDPAVLFLQPTTQICARRLRGESQTAGQGLSGTEPILQMAYVSRPQRLREIEPLARLQDSLVEIPTSKS